VKPTLSGEMITLEMEITLSSFSETTPIQSNPADEPIHFPVIEERKTKTGVKMRSGDTVLMLGKSSSPGKVNIIFINAKIIEPGTTVEEINKDIYPAIPGAASVIPTEGRNPA
jgi:hypothetical protein